MRNLLIEEDDYTLGDAVRDNLRGWQRPERAALAAKMAAIPSCSEPCESWKGRSEEDTERVPSGDFQVAMLC